MMKLADDYLVMQTVESPDVLESESVVIQTPKLAEPSLYKVLLLNDDFTPMDFVVAVLQNFFNKTHQQAIQIMLEVHHMGRATCGVYTRDIAETKINQVEQVARRQGHPLTCILEVI